MRKLANQFSKQECLKKVQAETFDRTSVSFYRYVLINDPETFRDELYVAWEALGVLGRIYVSREGINAQLSVPEPNFQAFRDYVDSLQVLRGVPFKVGLSEEGISFWKLTIKAREYILADGLSQGEYDVTNVGTHLSAKEFNDAMDDGAVVVDMRNNYESAIGHFEGAVRPDAVTFREELPMVLDELKGKEQEKILLYCTGGIRCEKASAYLKHNGFQDVNQLHGGIIDYKHQVDAQGLQTKYKGVNFVFDGRAPEVLTNDVLGTCHQCKGPANKPVDCANQVCHILIIQCESCYEKTQGTCSVTCKLVTELSQEEKQHVRKTQSVAGRVNVDVA